MEQVLENAPTTESAVETAASPTPAEVELKRPYPRMLVRHRGLNRHDRRQFARKTRLLKVRDTKEGIAARKVLEVNPANHPIRKVDIDGRPTYLFEPHFQAGVVAYREELAKQKEAFRKIMDSEDPNAKKVINGSHMFVAASRAFLAKVIELTTPKKQEPEEDGVRPEVQAIIEEKIADHASTWQALADA